MPSVLTVAVKRMSLQAHVVAHAAVRLGPTFSLALPPEGVVTSVTVRAGQSLHAGQQVATVNDRPVLVLPGSVPLWRMSWSRSFSLGRCLDSIVGYTPEP